MNKSFSEIISDSRPTLVDFFAEWCGPCKMMSPILQQLKTKLGDEVNIIKIDVDKNPGASQAYKIQSVPTLMLFRDGKMLWRQSGVPSLAQLEKLLAEHSASV